MDTLLSFFNFFYAQLILAKRNQSQNVHLRYVWNLKVRKAMTQMDDFPRVIQGLTKENKRLVDEAMKQWRIAIQNNSTLRQENEKLKLALEEKVFEIKKINLAAKSNVSEIGALKTKVTNLEDLVSQLQSDLDKAQKKASENEKQSVNAKFIRELDEKNELVSKHGQRKLVETRASGSVSLSKIPRVASSPIAKRQWFITILN